MRLSLSCTLLDGLDVYFQENIELKRACQSGTLSLLVHIGILETRLKVIH